MNPLRIFVMFTLVSSLALPAAVQAQTGIGGAGSRNYGIFGGGTGVSGIGNGLGSSNSFGRGVGSNQGPMGGFGQQASGGASPGALGQAGATGLNSGSTVSPYLNLMRPGSAAVNYYGVVRPQIRQNATNAQTTSSIQQSDRLLSEQQERIRQKLDLNQFNGDTPLGSQKGGPAPATGSRRRGDDDSYEFRKWATSYKD